MLTYFSYTYWKMYYPGRKIQLNDEEYYSFTQPYHDAMKILLTRLDVLNHTLYASSAVHPVHHIQHRIKAKNSLENKLQKLGYAQTVENAKDRLKDIAGIRVICYFIDDIYNLANILKIQSDLIFIAEKDYIANAKPNGYRSFHMILGVPVYCLDGMEYFPVEIQFRTLSMDFWASMEHRIAYKKDRSDRDQMTAELLDFANILTDIEKRFEQYNDTLPVDLSDTEKNSGKDSRP